MNDYSGTTAQHWYAPPLVVGVSSTLILPLEWPIRIRSQEAVDGA